MANWFELQRGRGFNFITKKGAIQDAHARLGINDPYEPADVAWANRGRLNDFQSDGLPYESQAPGGYSLSHGFVATARQIEYLMRLEGKGQRAGEIAREAWGLMYSHFIRTDKTSTNDPDNDTYGLETTADSRNREGAPKTAAAVKLWRRVFKEKTVTPTMAINFAEGDQLPKNKRRVAKGTWFQRNITNREELLGDGKISGLIEEKQQSVAHAIQEDGKRVKSQFPTFLALYEKNQMETTPEGRVAPNFRDRLDDAFLQFIHPGVDLNAARVAPMRETDVDTTVDTVQGFLGDPTLPMWQKLAATVALEYLRSEYAQYADQPGAGERPSEVRPPFMTPDRFNALVVCLGPERVEALKKFSDDVRDPILTTRMLSDLTNRMHFPDAAVSETSAKIASSFSDATNYGVENMGNTGALVRMTFGVWNHLRDTYHNSVVAQTLNASAKRLSGKEQPNMNGHRTLFNEINNASPHIEFFTGMGMLYDLKADEYRFGAAKHLEKAFAAMIRDIPTKPENVTYLLMYASKLKAYAAIGQALPAEFNAPIRRVKNGRVAVDSDQTPMTTAVRHARELEHFIYDQMGKHFFADQETFLLHGKELGYTHAAFYLDWVAKEAPEYLERRRGQASREIDLARLPDRVRAIFAESNRIATSQPFDVDMVDLTVKAVKAMEQPATHPATALRSRAGFPMNPVGIEDRPGVTRLREAARDHLAQAAEYTVALKLSPVPIDGVAAPRDIFRGNGAQRKIIEYVSANYLDVFLTLDVLNEEQLARLVRGVTDKLSNTLDMIDIVAGIYRGDGQISEARYKANGLILIGNELAKRVNGIPAAMLSDDDKDRFEARLGAIKKRLPEVALRQTMVVNAQHMAQANNIGVQLPQAA